MEVGHCDRALEACSRASLNNCRAAAPALRWIASLCEIRTCASRGRGCPGCSRARRSSSNVARLWLPLTWCSNAVLHCLRSSFSLSFSDIAAGAVSTAAPSAAAFDPRSGAAGARLLALPLAIAAWTRRARSARGRERARG